jgi:hypothetical protein
MTFKSDVSIAHRELSTKAYVEYSIIAKLVKSFGLTSVLNAIKYLPLKHPNPVGYIIASCKGKGVGNKVNVDIFNKE